MLTYFWEMYIKHHEYFPCMNAVLHGIDVAHSVCQAIY